MKSRYFILMALVAAMTISMLPAFAAAGETAAVEDVAPVAAEASAPAPEGYEFIPLDQLDQLTLPVAMNAAVSVLTR